MKLLKKNLTRILFVSLLALLFACGDSTRNDQGVSFTMLGWFQDATGTTGASGFTIPLSSSANEVGGEITDLLSFIGVQNHLVSQTIRVQRVHHSYVIPGATTSIPSTVVVFSGILAPTGTPNEDFNSGSSLPESQINGESIRYGEMAVVPSAIRSFLNLNRTQLPELPFVMIVRSYAVGVTSAGNSITSNDFETQVYVTEDVPIAPTDGTDTGTDGLGFNEFGDEESSFPFNNNF